MSWENLKEEALLLSSVYCSEGELTIEPGGTLTDIPSYPVVFVITLNIPASHCGTSVFEINLTARLAVRDSYTSSPPDIQLCSAQLSAIWLAQLQEKAREYAASLVPDPSLLLVANFIKEAVQDVVSVKPTPGEPHLVTQSHSPLVDTTYCTSSSSSFSSSSTATTTTSVLTHTCLVKVDHMRNENYYLGQLRKWSKELDVSCKVVNAGLHKIIALLKGGREEVQEFLKRWKTRPVDVDRQGRPCKERMMTVLSKQDLIQLPTG